MKSLYISVLLAMLGILSLSFLAFSAISNRIQRVTFNPVFNRFDELQLEEARDALNAGGPKGLRNYLANLDQRLGDRHYLLDKEGIDLASGENRAEMLPPSPGTRTRLDKQGHWIVTHRSPDGQYWFAAEGPARWPDFGTFLPYYFLVIGATCALCCLAAAGVISPIHHIATTIALFGQGNLSARVNARRQDEIGQLGRSFDQMAERLERLIVNERRLLSDISHELRSPLTRLKFAIKLARTSQNSDAALNRIERDVNRISSLVADIVEITFMEDDPAVQQTGIVSPREIVDEVACDCALEAEMRGCRIVRSGEIACVVLGNREILRRALENVLRNGIRYSPERSAIEITMAESSREAIIAIRDYGPGVPPEYLTRIFNPFFRVEDARDAESGGSGLGLSIAKRAVQLHHGAIEAENASPGLRVRITIPIAAQSAPSNHP